MVAEFRADGVSFSYPENWQLSREEEESGWTVTVQGPGSAFALVRLDRELPEPREVAETTLEALRSEYPDLDVESAVDMIGGEMAVGHDVQFFSFDFPVTCWTRSLFGGAGTVLVLCQFSDPEQETAEPVLRALCTSLRVDEE
jgi:hypothetical protein